LESDKGGVNLILNERYELVPTAKLTEHPDNPRRGDVEAIGQSIDANGFFGTLVVQKSTGHVLVGNHRLRAAIAKGIEEVPVVYVDVDDEKARRILLADNRLSHLATNDDEVLAALLKELTESEDGLVGTGYADDDLAALLKLFEDEGNVVEDPGPQIDKADELQKKWKTKPGQLWLVGAHRLLCGDCTNPYDVARVMDGKKAALFATDPPYLVNYDAQNHPSSLEYQKQVDAGTKKPKNKDWSSSYGGSWDDADANSSLYHSFIKCAVEIAIKPNAAWYTWHAQRRQAMLEAVWNEFGAFWHQTIHWIKNCPVLGYSYYMNASESCAFGWVKSHEPPRLAGDYPKNVWEFPNRGEGQDDIEHPTVKPVGVFTIPMEQHTKKGDICYEPFSGSGSQIVAGEQLGRKVYAIEIEPRYVAVALERLSGCGLTPGLEKAK
jgi:DNA modification methylase